MCMCVGGCDMFVYVSVCVDTFVSEHVCVMYVCACKLMFVCVWVVVCMYVCIGACMHVCVVCVHVCVCRCMY